MAISRGDCRIPGPAIYMCRCDLKNEVNNNSCYSYSMMFWFTQMTCYDVYIPLLIRHANDVEENPGPTIFDIIDPTRTASADYSQGNEALFGE